MMHHDTALRAAAQAIYNAVYPGDEWNPVPFEEAERFSTPHYRNAVAAAQCTRMYLTSGAERQLPLF